MAVDVSVCQQIQCGALYQSQVSPDVLLGCAEAGYSGEPQGCTSPTCAPYMDQMIANGYCRLLPRRSQPPPLSTFPQIHNSSPRPQPPAPHPSPVRHTQGNPNCLSAQTLLRPLPQIVPQTPPAPPQVCDTFTAWVATNPFIAGALLVAGYFLMTSHKGNAHE